MSSQNGANIVTTSAQKDQHHCNRDQERTEKRRSTQPTPAKHVVSTSHTSLGLQGWRYLCYSRFSHSIVTIGCRTALFVSPNMDSNEFERMFIDWSVLDKESKLAGPWPGAIFLAVSGKSWKMHFKSVSTSAAANSLSNASLCKPQQGASTPLDLP